MTTEASATPKIGDVARRAGVSTATVSRALSAPDTVRAETREIVLRAVRELGYTPNAAARNLRAGRTMLILVFVPKLANPFFSEVLRGIAAGLAAAGYGMIIGDIDNTESRERQLVDLVLGGHVDGAIVLTGRMPHAGERSLIDAGLPIIGGCARLAEPGLPIANILADDRGGAETQVAHLAALGHRRLLHISGPAGNFNAEARHAGFAAAAAAAGLAAGDLAKIAGDYTFAGGVAAGEAFLALPPAERPTGVAAASDEMAIGFMRRVRDAGLAIPRDVSVIGFDGMEFAAFCEPVLTTVVQPRRDIGLAAARTMLARLGPGPQPAAEDEFLPTTLRLGSSTGPAPGTPSLPAGDTPSLSACDTPSA